MSPCWASPTLFTYRVQTIPEGLLGVERKALYPQLRQHCQWNVFQLLLTLRWLQRKEWPETGSDRWRMSLVCMAFPGHALRVGAAPCRCSRGDARAAGSLPAALTWSKCCIPWGPAEPGALASLGASGSLSPCRPRWDLSGLIDHQAPQLACAGCSPWATACQPCAIAGWPRCLAGCGCSVCLSGNCGVVGCAVGLPQQLLSRESWKILPCFSMSDLWLNIRELLRLLGALSKVWSVSCHPPRKRGAPSP